MISFNAYTTKGIKKNANDDRILVDDKLLSNGSYSGTKERSLVSVICDGIGSASHAAEAAELIAESFRGFRADQASPSMLLSHLDMVNKVIVEEQERKRCGYGMASTIAGLIIYEGSCLAFNLGDTRIYRMQSGEFHCISFDHTAKNEGFYLPGGNMDALTRYMGGDGKACRPFFCRGTVYGGSMFLLCSDGIYKSVSESDIKGILGAQIPLTAKTDELHQLAVDGGSSDDMSIVLIDCL